MIDIDCFYGFWPFRRIPFRSIADIEALLSRTQTDGALVTPLAGVFYKDCLSGVREMLDELNNNDNPNLWPVAVVNPAFPGWKDDLPIMLDEWGCIALRLFPNYHGYRLPDNSSTALLEEVQSRQIPLILSVRIEDERLHHNQAKTPAVSLFDIQWLLRAFPDMKVILCGVKPDEIDRLQSDVLIHQNAWVEAPPRSPQFYLEELVEKLGPAHLIYGTGMPLQYPECARQQVLDARLSDAVKSQICLENAQGLFGIQTPVESSVPK